MRRIVLSVLIVMGSALALTAGKFWEDKPYQEWTQKEVATILTRSAWSHKVQIGGQPGGRGLGPPGQPQAGGSGMGGPMGTGGGGGSRPSGSLTRAPSGDAAQRGRGPTIYFVIWRSAKTVRRALARSQVLQGMATPEQVEQDLQQPVTNFVITIIGLDLSAFGQIDPEELKAHTYLRAKKQKKIKLRPQDVQIARRGPEEKIAEVNFIFPRALESGEPLIRPDEKKVEFRCEVKKAKIKIKTSFELKRMTLGGERDL